MSKSDQKLEVLYIDDEEENLEAFQLNCEEVWVTKVVQHPNELLSGKVPLDEVKVVLLDLLFECAEHASHIPVEDRPREGLELLAWIRRTHPRIKIIVISALLEPVLEKKIITAFPGVLCLAKPVDFSSQAFRNTLETFARSG